MNLVLQYLSSLPFEDIACMILAICFFVLLIVCKFTIMKKKGKKYEDFAEGMEEAGWDLLFFFK